MPGSLCIINTQFGLLGIDGAGWLMPTKDISQALQLVDSVDPVYTDGRFFKFKNANRPNWEEFIGYKLSTGAAGAYIWSQRQVVRFDGNGLVATTASYASHPLSYNGSNGYFYFYGGYDKAIVTKFPLVPDFPASVAPKSTGLKIAVQANFDPSKSKATATGSTVRALAAGWADQKNFGINSDSDMAACVSAACRAQIAKIAKQIGVAPPNDKTRVDVPNSFDWSKISVVMTPFSADVGPVSTNIEALTSQRFTNNSHTETTYTANLSYEVSNTVSNDWTVGSNLSISESVAINVGFGESNSVSATTTVQVDSSESQTNSVSKSKTTTLSESAEVTLQPGTSSVAHLSASHGTMPITVTYHISLVGDLSYTCGDGAEGSAPISYFLEAGGKPTSTNAVQEVEIGFYGEASIVTADK